MADSRWSSVVTASSAVRYRLFVTAENQTGFIRQIILTMEAVHTKALGKKILPLRKRFPNKNGVVACVRGSLISKLSAVYKPHKKPTARDCSYTIVG